MSSCEDCFPQVSDRCVLWTGPDIECVGIKNGESYSYNIVVMAEKLCEYINQKVDLQCLYKNDCNSCEATVKIPEAVQTLINKICNLTSDDIIHNGTLYCLSENLSSKSSLMDGRTFNMSVAPSTGNKTTVFYDLTPALVDLPEGISFSSVSASLNGKPLNGRTKIVDSKKESASFSIDYDRYPLDLTLKANFHTEEGDIILEKQVYIPDSVSLDKNFQLDTRSFISSSSSSITQKEINSALASNLCSLKTKVSSLETIDMGGCEEIKYNSNKTKSVIAQNSSVLCNHEKRLKDIEEVEVLVCGDGDCADTYESKSIIDAVIDMSKKICEYQREIEKLKARCSSLEEDLSNVSSNCDSCSGGNCSGTSGGSGTSGTGSCTSGNCG